MHSDWFNLSSLESFIIKHPDEPATIHITSWQHCDFSQVCGHVQASAKCWDTQTDAGAHQLQGPTRASPADRICQHSPRQQRFPGMLEGKTITQLTYPKPTVCKVFMKKFNTRNLIIFLLVHQHQPGYRKQMKYPSQNIQTPKTTYMIEQIVNKGHFVYVMYSTFTWIDSMFDCCCIL